jgi:nitric oxide reductase NorD protein
MANELDLTACVRARDQRTGHTVDDRLYIAVRPARRGLAIALLIDISGSTDEWIGARRRVIDVERSRCFRERSARRARRSLRDPHVLREGQGERADTTSRDSTRRTDNS